MHHSKKSSKHPVTSIERRYIKAIKSRLSRKNGRPSESPTLDLRDQIENALVQARDGRDKAS